MSRNSIIQEFYKTRVLEHAQNADEDLSWLEEGIKKGEQYLGSHKNSLIQQVEVLDSLRGLIRDDASLANFTEVASKISGQMKNYNSLNPMSMAIDQAVKNIGSDYSMYVNSMDQGSVLVDSLEYLEDEEDWVNLNTTVKGMPSEADPNIPKYEGAFEYLTAMNRNINSIMGRIANSSKGTQFRYDKEGNKYTDAEIKEKLDTFQKRLGVAVQAAHGNNIITLSEAQFIMLGDLDTYKSGKKDALSRLDKQINQTTNMVAKLGAEKRKLTDKGFGNLDFGGILGQIQNSVDIESKEMDETMAQDTQLKSTSEVGLDTELQTMITNFLGTRGRLMKAHEMWSGQPYYQDISDDSEAAKLLKASMEDVPGGDKKKTVDVTKIDLDVKENAWGNQPLSSYREDYERGSMTDDPNSPLYAIDGVYQYPELFEKAGKISIVKELPLKSLLRYSSWQNASQNTKNKGYKRFFNRDDIVEKKTATGGVKTVLNYNSAPLIEAYKSRVNKGALNNKLTEQTSLVRALASETGLKSKYVVEILEPQRKILKQKVDAEGKYVFTPPKESTVKISQQNDAIKKLARKIGIKGGYINFASKVIKAWNSLSQETKSNYDSFESWVEEELMKKELETKLSQ